MYLITLNVDVNASFSQVIAQQIRFTTKILVNVDVNILKNHPGHALVGTDGVVLNVLVCAINLQRCAPSERYDNSYIL